MALRIPQFDPVLRHDLEGIEEIREHTIAEYFFPDRRFKTAVIDPETTKVEDLQTYNNMTLEFANGKRLYYADTGLRALVYPTLSDGAAYGSLLFTPCQQFHELRVRALVIDDSTGATGVSSNMDILPRDEAKRLVGDCHGKIARHLAELLSNEPNRPFQFRLGIKPQEECFEYRIAKGTLAPANLDRLASAVRKKRRVDGSIRYSNSYDLVLPTSAFKGRKGKNAIAPGEYSLDIGLGIKTYAFKGPHRLGTQVLVNYPKGVQTDILPLVRQKSEELRSLQSEPHRVAAAYVESYEKQREYSKDPSKKTELAIPEFEEELDRMLSVAFGNRTPEQQEPLGYRIIKADIDCHGQLLDHPFVVDELRQFLRREWENTAFGRSVSFTAGLAQPSHDLKAGEICVPWLPKGEEVIVLRSPVLNSNGVILLKNVDLPEGRYLDGCVWIGPDTAAKYLQADFDGDRLAVDLASKYPTLRDEIAAAHEPENRYPDVVKRAKVPYEGVSFEEIALQAATDKVGIIANRIQKAIALRWEAEALPESEKAEYVRQVSQYYAKLVQPKSIESPPHPLLSSPYANIVREFAALSADLAPAEVDTALGKLKDMQKQIVGELSSELQVAVDGFKSADRPNERVLGYCEAASSYKFVAWLDDKGIAKRGEMQEKPYFSRPMQSCNHSPVDLMIKTTNESWNAAPLVPAQSHKFRGLFPTPDVETREGRLLAETARNILSIDRNNIAKAKQLQDLVAADPALGSHFITATTNGDRSILVTNLHRYAGVDTSLLCQKNLPMRLVEQTTNISTSKQLLAVIPADPARGRMSDTVLGNVSFISVKEHDLRSGKTFGVKSLTAIPPITSQLIDRLYQFADEYRESVRATTPPDRRSALAAAIWSATFTKQEHGAPELRYKKGRTAFAIFPEEVIQRLEEFQFSRLQASGLRHSMNEHGNRNFEREKVTIEIGTGSFTDAKGKTYNARTIVVDGATLGTIAQDSPTLLPGTKALAQVTSDRPTSVMLTTDRGTQLSVTRVKNYDYADSLWNGECKNVAVCALPSGRGNVLALVDGKPLGIFDRQSLDILRQHGFPTPSRNTFSAMLQTPRASSATVLIDPNSVVHPWEQESLRREYETLKHEASRLFGAELFTMKEVDRAIAALVCDRYDNPRYGMLVLSQSDQLKEWKETLPNLDYLAQARQYVGNLWRDAREAQTRREGSHAPEKTTGLER
ncbi:hypothetical protein B7486_29540 [cyanobacterium TDX16]|nr:hypothetical protein B7486_29540 [cyanobacterium TDX16]